MIKVMLRDYTSVNKVMMRTWVNEYVAECIPHLDPKWGERGVGPVGVFGVAACGSMQI